MAVSCQTGRTFSPIFEDERRQRRQQKEKKKLFSDISARVHACTHTTHSRLERYLVAKLSFSCTRSQPPFYLATCVCEPTTFCLRRKENGNRIIPFELRLLIYPPVVGQQQCKYWLEGAQKNQETRHKMTILLIRWMSKYC